MLKLHVDSTMSPEEVLKKAVGFFGPGGNNMEMKEQKDGCAYFEGGGGGVEVCTCPESSGSSVDIETREWEYQVKEFARMIKRK
jgi:hypothetical protein